MEGGVRRFGAEEKQLEGGVRKFGAEEKQSIVIIDRKIAGKMFYAAMIDISVIF